MAVLSKPVEEPKPGFSPIPVIDISNPQSKHAIVKACEDFGFFKVINHGVSSELVSVLEHEAVEFFSLPKSEKTQVAGYPFGYGNSKIGRNGDVGWVEYLLMNANLDSGSDPLFSGLLKNPGIFRFYDLTVFFCNVPGFVNTFRCQYSVSSPVSCSVFVVRALSFSSVL